LVLHWISAQILAITPIKTSMIDTEPLNGR
jgi:hypothetical protein